LRNSRGGDTPNVVQFAKDVQRFGAQGVTVHPRPDQRHIRYQDTRDLKSEVYTEFNVEGNPIQSFIDLVLEVKPTQVTLVPDAVDALTSNAGWDTIKHKDFLTEVITEFNSHGIRTSIFVDPILEMVEGAKITGADRIELYTESFAHQYSLGNKSAIEPFTKAAELSNKIGLGVNAGHDLSLDNIKFFKDNIPGLLEVSIGHALIAESLYLGIENVVQMYLQRLK
jgi:pyridoxine 5-phosphate synthase